MSEDKELPKGKIKALDPSVLPSLPTSWCWVSLNDLASPEAHAITDGPFGSNLKTEHYTATGPRVIRLQNIGDGVFNDEYAHIAERHYEQLTRHSVQAADIVVAGLGETLPRACVIPDWVGPAIVKADCPRVRLDRSLALPDFVCLALNSSGVQRRTSTVIHGVGRPRLNLAEIRGIWLPLAPLREQHRLVEKIEELFSDLDAGVSALQRAKANLTRYRASVLKSAVEGRLTEEWRKEHPQAEDGQMLLDRILRERREKWETDQLAKFKEKGKAPPKNWQIKYEEPSAPDTSELPELPEGWVWATVEQLGDVQLGRQRSPKNRSDKYPTKYIRSANLTEAGLDLGDVMDMEFLPHEKDTYRLHAGDILLAEASGSPDQVGKPVVWNNEIDDCCFQNTVIRLRPHRLPSAWPFLVFRQYYISKLFAKVSAGVGINHLSANKFSALSFPLPPLAEQEQIVALVEERLSQIDSAEKTIDAELIRAKRLRQSILKQAFEGKLVPQDPSDEPASVLLERIKSTREQEQPKKKAKKAGARTNSPRGQPR
jgi:type I restriction enzyme S subunit